MKKFVDQYNQSCLARHALITLNPGELHYYPFMVGLDRCDGSCNTLENLFDKVCVPNKTEYVTFKLLNTITSTLANTFNV